MSLNRTLAGLIDTAGDVKSASLDNAASLTVYATKEDLPSSGMSSGDQAYVTDTSRLYISNGSGWYNVALINATPTLTISPTGEIELSTEGATTIITLTATDSDNAVAGLTYSVESDGSFAGLGTISQDSSVFTITPLSADSATTVESTLTFKASDGISFGSGTRTFTLSFKAQYSNYTTVLLKADTTGTDNQVDASTNSYTITENGNVTSTAFTPHHPGGYSTYFDGSGDYLLPAITTAVGTSDFTLEGWFYPTSTASDTTIFDFRSSSNYGIFSIFANNTVGYYNGFSNVGTTSNTVTDNTWNHIAIVRNSGSIKIYINGVLGSTTADTTNWTLSDTNYGAPRIGGNKGNNAWMNGYIADVRFVSGTAVYTSAFTPPTETLTAIANTQLLTCHAPYIADGSTNGHAITVNGNTVPKRFGPYDYLGYTKADHGGSVYFDGTGDTLSVPSDSNFAFGTGDFTVEGWFYQTSDNTYPSALEIGNHLYSPGILFIVKYSGQATIYSGGFYGGANTSLNQWNHIAWVRSSGSLKIYVNGTLGSTTTFTNNLTDAATIRIASDNAGGAYYTYTGYISNLRIVKGTAVYTSNFTPPTAPLTAITNTSLLTCTNKNDIWDASSGSLLTKVGNTTASNTQRKFLTSSSVYFDGTGDNIDISDNTDLFQFGSGDFTIEGWYKADTTSGDHYIIDFSGGTFNAGTTHFGINIYQGNWRAGGFDDKLVGGVGSGVNTGIDTTTWHHFALVHASQNLKYYIDGTQIGSTVSTTGDTFNCGSTVSIGGYHTGGLFNWDGYLQDFRITKGLARYTSNFTPPTAEFGG